MGVVLVTGCSSGFGLLTAVSFARRGDRVFATMRDTAKSGDLMAAASAAGVTVEVMALDVTDDASVTTGIAGILADAGQIDVLVNNAGVGARAAIEMYPDRVVRDVFETNVFGVWRMVRAVLPGMRERGSGAIVNVSSIAGLVAPPFNGLYSSTKHALEAMTEAMAFEVETFGVRVALIEPGYFQTNIGVNVAAKTVLTDTSPYAEAERQAVERMHEAVAGGGDPQVVADLIVEAATTEAPRLRWLAGDDAQAMATARRTMSESQWAELIRGPR